MKKLLFALTFIVASVACGAPTTPINNPALTGTLALNQSATTGSAVIPPANLGTGTASSSNYLRGDGTWQYAAPPTSANLQLNSLGLMIPAGYTSAVLGVGQGSTVLSPTYNAVAALNGRFTATSGNSWGMTLEPSFVASGATGTSNGLSLQDTYNLTGGSTNTDTDFNLTRIETSLGSGSHYFENFNVAGSGTKWSVDHLGNATGNSFNVFANIAALRAASTSGCSNGAVVSTVGYYAQNDGGQGTYVWNSSSTAPDDGGITIQPTGVTTGRWIRSYSGLVNVRWYGAHGNGSTDDTAALAAALAAATGNGLFFPAGTYPTTAALSYNAQTGGPITIAGVGPNSILYPHGTTNGALLVSGTAGSTIKPVSIANLAINDGTSGGMAYGLHLSGIAHFKVDGVWVTGNNSTSGKAFWITGSQQGEVAGGQAFFCTDGAYIEDDATGTVASNGIEWHGMTFQNALGDNLLITSNSAAPNSGGAGDISFHSNHLTTALQSIDLYGSTQGGIMNISENHIEPGAGGVNKSIIVRAGQARIVGNTITGTATDLELTSGTGYCIVIGNLIDGTVTLDSGTTKDVVAFNITGGTVTDSGTQDVVFENPSFSGTPLRTDTIWNSLSISASTHSGGDILTLNPQPSGSYVGPWGMTINGAGSSSAGDEYVAFNNYALAGSTAGHQLNFESAPGGTVYAGATQNGLFTNIGGTVTLSTGSGTITNSSIKTSSVIILTMVTSGGTPGTYTPLVKAAAGSATVTGLSTDTSTYNWRMMQ